MPSTLTWLDYSERDRRNAIRVIDLFRETGTVDELGLAGIANSFADLFFPGTSTTQTRACYFLFVPWTFREIERRKVRSSEVGEIARRMELALSRLLRSGADPLGVFGKRSGDALKRLPSEAYWGGLGSWGIRLCPGHKWKYFRSLDGHYRLERRLGSSSRDPEGRSPLPANWHPHLPAPPSGFPDQNVSVALRRQDAGYLRERIQARHPESLLAVLAGRAEPADLAVDRPWQLADCAEVSSTLRGHILDARSFAHCMQGAVILYNMMLAEKRERDDWTGKHRAHLERWAVNIGNLQSAVGDWTPDGVWRMAMAQRRSVKQPTREFVERWVGIAKRIQAGEDADNDNARSLVRQRETQLKGGRARLANPRRLELWGGSTGTGLMSYRWGPAKRILTDVFDGLAR